MIHFVIDVLSCIHIVLGIWVCFRAIHFVIRFKRWPFLITEVSFLAHEILSDGIVSNVWQGFERPPWIILNIKYALCPISISMALIARVLPREKWAIWFYGYGAIFIGSCMVCPFLTVLELNDLIAVVVFSRLAFQCFQKSTKYLRGLIDLNFAIIYFFGILIFIMSKNITKEFWGNSNWLSYFAAVNFVVHITFLYLLVRAINQQNHKQVSPGYIW